MESGKGGGGSFESLYQHLQVINRNKFCPVVVFLNNTQFVELVKELEIPVYVLTSLMYSKQVPRFIGGAIRQLALIVDKYAPGLYLAYFRLVHLPMLNALKLIVEGKNIDLIHLNVSIARDLFGVFVSEKTGVPCICQLRSIQGGNFDQKRAEFANSIVSAYVANSNMTKNYWEKKGLTPDKIRVIHNGIPFLDIKPADLRFEWGIAQDVRFIVGCVARLAWWKGHHFLLKAFAAFVKSYPNSILLIVGDGAIKKNIVWQVNELGIDDKVIFTGEQSGAKGIIAGLDLLVLPSLNEPFGRVLLEAMLLETPVVSTNAGGVPEIVQHEYNGLLVEFGEEGQLVEAMERVFLDESLRLTLIKNGHQTIMDKFSMERYARAIEQVYDQTLSQDKT